MSKIKVLLFGGTGTLGQELILQLDKKKYNVWAPTHEEVDLINIGSEEILKIQEFNPNIIIHTAGLIDTELCEASPSSAIRNNILNTADLVEIVYQFFRTAKFIYISSEYVFGEDGKGFYTVYDRLNPMNVYGKTKAAAEYIVSILPNHQIIRAPFFKKYHKQAYVDQFTSRLTVENAARCIIDELNCSDEKIIHISTNFKESIHESYKNLGVEAEPVETPEHLKKIIPRDTSLIDSRLTFR